MLGIGSRDGPSVRQTGPMSNRDPMRPDPILGDDGVPFCPNCYRVPPIHSEWCGYRESVKGRRTPDNQPVDF